MQRCSEKLEKRRGLSVQQVLGLLIGSAILVFLIRPIAVIFLGTIIGPVAASVFIAILVMFIFEDMRSSNIAKKKKVEEVPEEQESLDEVLDSEPEKQG